jgi:hypothetical protein
LIVWLIDYFCSIYHQSRLLILNEEYRQILEEIYYKESVDEYVDDYYIKLIDQLLIDQDKSNMQELLQRKNVLHNKNVKANLIRSISSSSSNHSNYFIDYNNDENQLLNKQ